MLSARDTPLPTQMFLQAAKPQETQVIVDGSRETNRQSHDRCPHFRHADLRCYYSDICVGAVACRLEKKDGGAIRVYIMTLGVLAPYRGLGIGGIFGDRCFGSEKLKLSVSSGGFRESLPLSATPRSRLLGGIQVPPSSPLPPPLSTHAIIIIFPSVSLQIFSQGKPNCSP
ncbi:hypothetical protein KSP40_PGU012936 [Platanthera guangdongensis]|uniref:N-acetyltransferase domain-containing protein n=1 Tax=Platanthera guangdongensis TaxID=2320717 RepID=A0ABR2LNQ8_9ASPA